MNLDWMLQPSRFHEPFASSARIAADIKKMSQALVLDLRSATTLISSG